MNNPLTVLKTVEDVDNAPVGTVVETVTGRNGALNGQESFELVKKELPARVLRWGEDYYPAKFERVIKTLADMTKEERQECQWMQCETEQLRKAGLKAVITRVYEASAELLTSNGVTLGVTLGHVIPRFDLPRLVWPGEEPQEPLAVDGWVGRELRTWKDFGVAPVGTICADVGGDTALKRSENRWAYLGVTNTNDNMSRVDCGPFTVIAVAES